MITLPGYKISSQIYETSNSLIYRGRRQQDNQPVILKFLKADYPTPTTLIRYKQEYEITQKLNINGVIRAYSLEKYQATLVMILEDFGGESLKLLMDSKEFSLLEFLELAIAITKILGEIHQQHVVHKDINPANIVLNSDTRQIKIIDFGISSVLSRENPPLKNPHVLEGTLAYISPEQTGRMNRAMDYRTDFYSLGVTFYELLTGQLPCDYNDAMEVVHCHIAKLAVSPHEIDSNIPKAVSDIVMKLLAKTAEDRYQTSWGIVADLELCLRQLQATGRIADFAIAQQDISDKFQIPQKLYGREAEVETLLSAFERVSTGTTEIMLVSGYSGIGKSALVQEIYKPITKARGYFIAGKFDQFQRNIPYSAIVKAFQSLIKQLLTENETQLNNWKEKLLTAFGANGQVIIDVIPEVELIVGKQPPVQELSATEAQYRFNLIFQKFMRVFCSVEHPLAIFLDDLQWADSASLKLLQVMMNDEETKYLFLIGAYRDNEVNPNHPLIITLNELEKLGRIINKITLTTLPIQHISNLIADTVRRGRESVMSLAELVLSKTQGNPFFVNQFLRTLYQENLLKFNYEQRNWHWDISEIEAVGITDNVVELMLGKLKKLPDATQQVLRLAACVGNDFDLNTLAIINQKPITATYQYLLPALQDGLLLPTSELDAIEEDILNSGLAIATYKFLHDRVQQAAYALIEENAKKTVHLQIGRLLWQNTSPEKLSEEIFKIVDHLNLGIDIVSDEFQRHEIAKLNLIAGEKAKAATAYTAATQYLKSGREILLSDTWNSQYCLTCSLYKAGAEVEYLNGNFENSQTLINQTLQQSSSAVDKAEMYNLLVIQYTMDSKPAEAIEVGRIALKLLGIDLPKDSLNAALNVELAAVNEQIGGRSIASLIENTELKMPEKKAAMKILNSLVPPAYFVDQALFSVIIAKAVNLSLKYGDIPESAYMYSCYGILQVASLQNYRAAYEFAVLGLKTSEKYNNLAQKCRALQVLVVIVSHWRKPLSLAHSMTQEAYHAGWQSGELQFIAYTYFAQCYNRFYQGYPLNEYLIEIKNYLLFAQKTKNQTTIDVCLGFSLTITSLAGKSDSDFGVSEEQHLKDCNSRNVSLFICPYLVLKSQISYLFEQYDLALKYALDAEARLAEIPGIISIAEQNFYHSLILAALYNNASESDKNQYWLKIEANQKQMQIWADSCPENFLHKYLLVQAEIARISGENLATIDLYDQAIASAKENEFIQNEALGNELAAKFCLDKGKAEFAQLYIQKAHYGYQLWGAKRKVEHLEAKYPQLLAKTSVKATTITTVHQSTAVPNTSTSLGTTTLDLATVMKASQAISGEIVLSNLLARLMKIVIENAGAQKGFLILEKAGNWVIEAEGAVGADDVTVMQSIPIYSTEALRQTPLLSKAIVNYVIRTQENVVLNNGSIEGQFTNDPYIASTKPKSILCTPLLHQGKLTGIFYLENNLTEAAFTTDRLELLKLLSSQIAISIQNAQLYKNLHEFNQNLEQLVAERTEELSNTLDNLKSTQTKLVEAEKMASLGGLVAGIAHEINTPVGVGVTVASALAEHTSEFVTTYKSGKMKRSDLEEFVDIATQSSNVLLVNLNQAAQLIQSFKRVAVDQSSEERRTFKLRDYLDEILLQLKPKLKQTKHAIAISGDTNISLDSYPGALSQIVTNLLMNSVIHAYHPDIVGTILIDIQQEDEQVILKYADDGQGIPAENLSRIYEPFFTTKRGQGGSGLGLHLVYNLVTQKLQGEIECQSQVGTGTKFIIKFPLQVDCRNYI